jgi:hypothetical protein
MSSSTYSCPTKSSSTPKSSRPTQRGRIFELLIAAKGGWIPLPEIAGCATQYGARILELRRIGFRIENRIEQVDGVRRSWFRLLPPGDPEPERLAKAREWLRAARGEPTATNQGLFPEFGNFAPGSRY